ncbi:MAG: C39 family peptidase [Oscillospiraceae bacterium]|nr:C39 family peptidase [Oscillospiraceae bacterium]
MSRHDHAVLAALTGLLLTGCGFESISSSVPGGSPDSSVSTVSETAVQTQTTVKTEKTTASPEPPESPATESNDIPLTDEKPERPTHLIQNVPHLDQTTGYATACESLAAVSLLQFYGIQIEPGEFIRRHLPTADYPVMGEDGNLHGESPWEYFIGDPLRSNGYCCFSGAIKKAIDSVEPGITSVLRGETLDELCENYVAKNHPVLIWATIRMQPTRLGHTWILPNGERYTHLRPVHALLLIGWDEEHYYFSDSLQPDAVTAYGISETVTAYNAMQQQAIILTKPAPAIRAED